MSFAYCHDHEEDHAQEVANALFARNLINCYLREIGRHADDVQIYAATPPLDVPLALHSDATSERDLMLVRLPSLGVHVGTLVLGAQSGTGTIDTQGDPFMRDVHGVWTRLTGERLVELISAELSQHYAVPNAPDFLTQAKDSLRVLRLIVQHSPHKQPVRSFIDAEQSLISGHPFHPSPKSRIGFSERELQQYSPEFNPRFLLHYFAVHRDDLVQESMVSTVAPGLICQRALPKVLDADFTLVPVHPWQARYLLRLDTVQTALRRGRLRNVGEAGPDFYPTSSVRTVFSPEHDYSYKLSLNVRITNCIRGNAPHELKSALEINRAFCGLADFAGRFPKFQVLEEPAFLTTLLDAGFGMMFRDARPILESKSPPWVAAALFGNGQWGRDLMARLLPGRECRVQWLGNYLDLLLPPLFELLFTHGLMFEPHLQNVLVSTANLGPDRVFLRDLDNAKVVQGSPAARLLPPLAARVEQEILYSQADAWPRFFYCLIVNHLCEAIFQMGYGVFGLEQRLWALLKEKLEHHVDAAADTLTKQSILRLLHGKHLPAKANLTTRFQRIPDRHASYFGIPNPMCRS